MVEIEEFKKRLAEVGSSIGRLEIFKNWSILPTLDLHKFSHIVEWIVEHRIGNLDKPKTTVQATHLKWAN